MKFRVTTLKKVKDEDLYVLTPYKFFDDLPSAMDYAEHGNKKDLDSFRIRKGFVEASDDYENWVGMKDEQTFDLIALVKDVDAVHVEYHKFLTLKMANELLKTYYKDNKLYTVDLYFVGMVVDTKMLWPELY